MKFSEQWLRDWVTPQLDTQAIADQITMAGLEVDAVEPVAASFSGVVVAEVLTKEKHPDADKLNVCTVNDGVGSTGAGRLWSAECRCRSEKFPSLR
ncbi:hypothetical protein DK37_03340 [Halomonas sp. SUBG004]|nr:hypothetical protein DK37_03340 [Halomonas sp. SUBG004]